MGELGAFVQIARMPTPQRDPRARVADYEEIYGVASEKEAARESDVRGEGPASAPHIAD